MKRLINSIYAGALSLLLVSMGTSSAYSQDATKSPLVVNLAYYSINNQIPSLTVIAKTKIDGKFQPVGGMEVKLYLDKDSTGKGLGFIGKVVTNDKGQAGAIINPALAPVWKAGVNHTFIAITDK